MARLTEQQRKLISHLTSCQLCGKGGDLHLVEGAVVMCDRCYKAHKSAAEMPRKPQRRQLERRLNYLEAWKTGAEWLLKNR